MTATNSSNNKLSLKIFVERTKKPFVFIAVCLIAALALYKVHSEKTNFDKEQNKSWIVVDNAENNTSVNEVNFTSLVTNIGVENSAKCNDLGNIQNNPNNKLSGSENNEEEIRIDVICNSVGDIKYQEFKNKGELISKLTEVILARKERDLIDLQGRIDKSRKDENEIEEIRTKALVKFNSAVNGKTVDEVIYIDSISQNVATKTLTTKSLQNLKFDISDLNLDTALLYQFKDKRRMPHPIKYIRTEINEFYQFQKTLQQNHTATVKAIYNKRNNIYPSILGKVYTAKEKLKAETKKPEKPGTKADQSPGSASKSVASYIYDDKQPLSVIFQLIRITLICIIVFGLLYIILIPLQHIFFLTAVGEALKGQASKLADKKDVATSAGAAAVSKTAGVIITTITLIGIGTVVIASNEFGNTNNKRVGENNPELEAALIDSRLKNPNSGIPGTNPETGGGIGRREIDELVLSLKELRDSVNGLKTEITELPLEDLKNLPVLASTIDSINKTLHNGNNPDDEQTILGKLNKVSKNTDEFSKISDVLGNEEDLDDAKTVYRGLDKLNKVYYTLTTDRDIDNNPSVLKSLTDVNTTLTKLKDNNDKDTLLQNLKDVSDTLTTNELNGQPSMYARLNNVSDTIGTKEYQNTQKPMSIFKTLSDVSDTLTGVSDTLTNEFTKDNNLSLLGIIKSNDKNTTDIGRYIFANSDGNFFTQFKNAFKGERYQVTKFSCELLGIEKVPSEILNELGCEISAQLPSTSKMQKPSLLMSDDELLSKLENSQFGDKANKEKWNMYKQLILRFTRVSRY